MVETELKKQVIDCDNVSFEKYTKLQNEAKQVFEQLKELHKQVLGDLPIRNYKEYLEDSTTYLINAWFEANSKYYPPNTIPQRAFLVVDVEAEDIGYACTKFNNLIKELHEHAPVIKSDGLQWKVKKESFQKYLNPELEAHYNALNKLIDCVNELEQFESVYRVGIFRSSNNIVWQGLDLTVSKSNFIK